MNHFFLFIYKVYNCVHHQRNKWIFFHRKLNRWKDQIILTHKTIVFVSLVLEFDVRYLIAVASHFEEGFHMDPFRRFILYDLWATVGGGKRNGFSYKNVGYCPFSNKDGWTGKRTKLDLLFFYLPSNKMTTSSWAYSLISTSQARILSKLVLFVTSYKRSKAKKTKWIHLNIQVVRYVLCNAWKLGKLLWIWNQWVANLK